MTGFMDEMVLWLNMQGRLSQTTVGLRRSILAFSLSYVVITLAYIALPAKQP